MIVLLELSMTLRQQLKGVIVRYVYVGLPIKVEGVRGVSAMTSPETGKRAQMAIVEGV